MNGLDAVIGRFVWSKAGRDKDRLFVIIDIADDAHVLIADGDLRPVSKPKKKKLKHLKVTQKIAEEISQTVINRKRLTDDDLRKAVQGYLMELTDDSVSEEG